MQRPWKEPSEFPDDSSTHFYRASNCSVHSNPELLSQRSLVSSTFICNQIGYTEQEVFRRRDLSTSRIKKFEDDHDRTVEWDFADGSAAFVRQLKSSAKQKDLLRGSTVHVDILKRGLLEINTYVANTLIYMYATCGALAKAQEVFDSLPTCNTVSWNALISGYAQHGQGSEVMSCFQQMQDKGISANAITFVCILKACGSLGAAKKGAEIHAMIDKLGLLESNGIIGNALVDMYAKCGLIEKAQEMFDELVIRDVVSWNALITGYAQKGCCDEALNCLKQMQDKGQSPDAVTFVSILKACSCVGAVKKGEEIHAQISKQSLLGKNGVLGNALVDMYAKCGALAKAQEVFDELPERNVVSWNVLLTRYSQQGHPEEVLSCFGQMCEEGIFPNALTFVCVLKACGCIGAAEQGEEIHAEIRRRGLLKQNIVLGTALVDMYQRCGVLTKAQLIFNELPIRDSVSWTALIAGYAKHGCGDEALKRFEMMLDEGFNPDAATYVCILKACGIVGAAGKGEQVYTEVSKQGLVQKNILVGNALVDMYCKCGQLARAQEEFKQLPIRDMVSWNALMAGYAQLGVVELVSILFNEMIEACVKPDLGTYVVLLTACSHAGLVREGQFYFVTMSSVDIIIPTVEHYICIIDLFCRAGNLAKAIDMIEKLPPLVCLPLWSALLGACRKWINVRLGRWAFEHAIQLNEEFDIAYVCMSNLYVAIEMGE